MSRLRVLALLAAGLAVAAAVRWPLLPYESVDYQRYYENWYGFLVANDHFAALRYDFANYNTPYLTLLAAVSFLLPGLRDVFAIKALSLVFDLTLAFFVGKCVALRYPESRVAPVLAGLSTLLLPTVVLNSAMWGQADAIYTTFLVAGLYFLLRAGGPRAEAAAFVCFGLAVSFKAQALFLAPALLWFAAKRALSLRFAFLAPLAYAVTLLPAWLAGRPIYDLLLIYANQTQEFRSLSIWLPNPWQWVSNEHYEWWPLGLVSTAAFVLGAAAVVRRARAAITPELLLALSAFSLFAVPYLLPKMQGRYFFPAGLLALVVAFRRPRLWYWPVFLELVSLTVYAGITLDWPIRHTVVPALAIPGLALLVVLARGLLRDLGVRLPPEGVREWLLRRVRARRAAAIPLAVLAACLAAVFAFGLAGGRFTRSAGDDPVSVRTLARAAHLSPEHSFVPFTRRTLDADGAAAVVRDGGAAPLGDLLLGLVRFGLADDPATELAAARVAMAAFFCLAALLAYLSLVRLTGRRYAALGATLLAFSSFTGGAWDSVAVEQAPALFSVFLVFHGLVVFAGTGGGRPALPQLLVKCGAALALSFAAYSLLVPFVLLGLVSAFRQRRRRAPGRNRDDSPPPDALPAKGFRALRYPPAILAVFVLGFGGALVGLSRVNERALADSGLRLTERPAAAAGASVAERARRAAGALLPYALYAPYALPAPGGNSAPERPDEVSSRQLRPADGRVGEDPVAAGAGTLLVALLLIGSCAAAAFSRHRRLLLPLAVSGVFLALSPGGAGPGTAAPAGAVGASLALFAAAFPRRPPEERGPEAARIFPGVLPGVLAVGLAAALFLFSGHRAGSTPTDAGTAAFEARVQEDFAAIRRQLRWRPEEERAVFLPAGLLGGNPLAAPDALSRALAGNLLIARPGQRRLAEFEIADRRGARPRAADAGLLTPENRELVLYHRAARDGEVSGMIAAAGTPVIRAEFDVYLHQDHLWYVREGCRPEHRRGLFVLHFDPADTRELPPGRRQFGFDNRSFRFPERALDRGERCVARARFPDYAVRRLFTGRHPGPAGADWVWTGEFFPESFPEGPPPAPGSRPE